jgi:GNAT superfamily N-acetyltransferase
MKGRPKKSEIVFHPATPRRWADLETLFGDRGACAGCWCMWARLERAEYVRGKGAGNKRSLRALVAAGKTPGILAYVDGEVAGWCAIGPRAGFRRLEKSRVLEPVDDQPVWSVVCFFVARPFRRRGLSVALLEEAARFAKKRGARIVEGYPVDTGSRRAADAFVWTGLSSTFERAGFVEVLRRSKTRPIMRQTLARKRSDPERRRG